MKASIHHRSTSKITTFKERKQGQRSTIKESKKDDFKAVYQESPMTLNQGNDEHQPGQRLFR